MYDHEFDTDWESLTTKEALHRAYALGVSASLGEEYPSEYERILDEAGTGYDRQMIELAYEEGMREATDAQIETDDETQVWSELVSDTDIEVDIDSPEEPLSSSVPAVLTRAELFDPPDDSLDKFRLPEFLTRRR